MLPPRGVCGHFHLKITDLLQDFFIKTIDQVYKYKDSKKIKERFEEYFDFQYDYLLTFGVFNVKPSILPILASKMFVLKFMLY